MTLSIRTSLVDADSLSGRRIARTVRTIRCFRQPKSVLNTPPYYFSTVRVPSTTEELACFIASVRVFSSIRSAARNVTAASARRGAPGCAARPLAHGTRSYRVASFGRVPTTACSLQLIFIIFKHKIMFFFQHHRTHKCSMLDG